ncbi:MAG: hypothetical protein JWQ34_3770 [Mucilaginibacter sp.]|nr:hypothetical protein [Mucilaginibacter sp.]MDB5005545.1 hypothetical protein [Mucilaginibacter sp.]
MTIKYGLLLSFCAKGCQIVRWKKLMAIIKKNDKAVVAMIQIKK